MGDRELLRGRYAMKYALAEVFKTLQGEGLNGGRSAIFVRFAGCNLWSGNAATREKDAERTGAHCPLFCDTDFQSRFRCDSDELVHHILHQLPASMVVFTGGEPMLQLTHELLFKLRKAAPLLDLAVETNGTVLPKDGVVDQLDHVCVSPKVPDERIVLRQGDELKVVYPRYRPEDFAVLATGFRVWWVSPEAMPGSIVGTSKLQSNVEKLAAEWVRANPPWRLSLQQHKHLGIP